MITTDVLIIGGGPAGVTTALYAARAGFKTIIINKDYGALEKAESIENFYGHTQISGRELAETGLEQARHTGAEAILGEAVGICVEDNSMICVQLADNSAYTAKAVMLATGATRATPNIPGLKELAGRGVSYCAICDGFLFRGKEVAVLGGGAYALNEAKELIPLASPVTVLTNGEEPSAAFPDGVIMRKEKIKGFSETSEDSQPGTSADSTDSKTIMPSISIVVSRLKGVILDTEEELPISGLFVAVGTAGGSELARKIGAELNQEQYVAIKSGMRTSIPGIWAAGDCTGGLKQIAKAVYEGAQGGTDMVKYLRQSGN